jgi:hypothetical protein
MAFARLPVGALATRWPKTRIRTVMLVVLVLRLLASTRTEFAHVLFSPDYRDLAASHAEIALAEAARIASSPGPVACSNLVVCRMANKPFLYDAFKVEMLRNTHTLSNEAIGSAIRAHGLTFVTIDPRANVTSLWRRYPLD